MSYSTGGCGGIDPFENTASPAVSPRLVGAFSGVLDLLNEGVVVLDAEGKLEYVSARTSQILGYSERELTGQPLASFLSFEAVGVAFSAGEILETSFLKKSGGNVRVRMQIREIPSDASERTGVVAVITDLDLNAQSIAEDAIVLARRLMHEVEERKRTEVELAHRKEVLRGFFEHAPCAMGIIDLMGDDIRMVRVNRILLESFNLQAGLIEGRTMRSLGLPEDLHALWSEKLKRCLENQGAAQGFEYDRVIEGNTRVLSVAVGLIGVGEGGCPRFSYVVQDITRVVQSERKLFESENRFLLSQEFTGTGTWDVNFVSGLVTWSPSMRKIFMLDHDQPDPTSVEDVFSLVHPDDCPALRHDLAESIQNRSDHHAEFRVISSSGEIRWVEGRGRGMFDAGGQCVRVVGAAIDITERKRADELLKLQSAQIAGLSKMSALGEMASGIAHEVNNPLTVISAFSTLIKRELAASHVDRDKINNLLGTIRDHCQRIAKITEGLRFFARDGAKDSLERVRLSEILSDTLVFCSERFKKHQISLSLGEFSPAVVVDCRPVQISQVILNLLNNAHDAVHEAQTDRQVRVEVCAGDDYVSIQVRDNGPGIAPGWDSRIFEPFMTTKPPGKGVGLGLSISQGIMGSHGGQLTHRRQDGWTVFEAIIPVVANQTPHQTREVACQ